MDAYNRLKALIDGLADRMTEDEKRAIADAEWAADADLAAERKRRETAEGQLQTTHQQVAEVARLLDPDVCPDAWGLHAAAQRLLARAEQAERERDEARRDKRDMGAIISNTLDALEGEPDDSLVGLARARRGDLARAEADNAALLDDISEAARLLREDYDPSKAGQILAGALIAGRRGTALLERLRALEVFLAGVPGLVIIDMRNMVERGVASDVVRAALKAYDALKEKACDECGMVGTHKLQCGRRG